MKKEGRSGTAGEGGSWRILLSRHVADGKLERQAAGWVEGERTKVMEKARAGRGGSGRSGCGLAGGGQSVR